jgi:hypothetical protein
MFSYRDTEPSSYGLPIDPTPGPSTLLDPSVNQTSPLTTAGVPSPLVHSSLVNIHRLWLNTIHHSQMPQSGHISSHTTYNCSGHRQVHKSVFDNKMWNSYHSTEWPTMKIHLILLNTMSKPNLSNTLYYICMCKLLIVNQTSRSHTFHACQSHEHTQLASLWPAKKVHERVVGNYAFASHNFQIKFL